MSGSSKQTQSTDLSIPDFFKPYWNQGMQGASDMFKSGGFAPVVGMSNATKQGLESNLALADNFDKNIAGNAQNSYLSLLNSNLVNSAELQSAIGAATSPVQQQLERYQVPMTQDAAMSAGQFGSSRQGIAEGLARSDANQQMANIGSQMSWQALQQDQQNKQFANANLGNWMASMQIPANLRTMVGGVQEGYQQEAANAPAQNLLQFMQILQAMNPGSNSTTTQTSSMSNFQKLAALGNLVIGGAKQYATAGAGG
ncbi:MAG: hypothetical protein [Siphoviridae sp. ct7UA22]|nr:MAG: hypothetical protein [Siphoviridae sp. ct7UA22]